MKILLVSLMIMLSGCVFVKTQHVKIWALCYQDDILLPNGMYQSNELEHIHCNKRRELDFKYTPGEHQYIDVLMY